MIASFNIGNDTGILLQLMNEQWHSNETNFFNICFNKIVKVDCSTKRIVP